MTDPALVFLHADHFSRCTAVVDKHFDGYYTLQLITAGRIELSYDGRRHVLKRGWMWPCFPGPRIQFHRAPGTPFWEHRYVAFQGPRVSLWTEMALLPFEPQLSEQIECHAAKFDRLLALVKRPDPLGRLRAVNLLEGLLLELADQRRRKATATWIEQVKECLARQGTLWPDYAAIAQSLNMGLSTLRRRFRAATGISLHHYTLLQRVQIAKDLLGETSLSMKEIAQRLGYGDAYFFSRQFTEIAEVSPTAYRRSRQSRGP